MEGLVDKALKKKGFSLLEIIFQCPVHYGRQAGMGLFKIRIGGLVDKEIPTYQERLDTLHLKEKAGEIGIAGSSG